MSVGQSGAAGKVQAGNACDACCSDDDSRRRDLPALSSATCWLPRRRIYRSPVISNLKLPQASSKGHRPRTFRLGYLLEFLIYLPLFPLSLSLSMYPVSLTVLSLSIYLSPPVLSLLVICLPRSSFIPSVPCSFRLDFSIYCSDLSVYIFMAAYRFALCLSSLFPPHTISLCLSF